MKVSNDDFRDDGEEGGSVACVFRRAVVAGEEDERVGGNAEGVDFVGYAVDVAVESLVSLLEPLMVEVLGGMVGTIVVAMFLPMVKMIESLQ